MQQLHAQALFQRADLAADGARRHVQLFRRGGDAQVPGRRFKGAQGVQGRQFVHAGESAIRLRIAQSKPATFIDN
ncbi:hypothetical protein D3C72_2002060 [compost metagenome]